MFKKKKDKGHKDPKDIVQKLISISELDTVFRDIYLNRARLFFNENLPYDEYDDLVKFRAYASKLQKKISVAIEKDDWKSAKELAVKVEEIKNRLDENQVSLEIGRKLYDDLDNIKISPFISELQHIEKISSGNLSSFRDLIIQLLDELQVDDSTYSDFYTSRHDSFISILFRDREKTGSEMVANDEASLRQQAEEALKSGDMEHIEKIAELLISKQEKKKESEKEDGILPENDSFLPGRTTVFSEKILSKAGKFGLIPVHIDQSKDFSILFRNALHPGFEDDPEKAWQKLENTGALSALSISNELKRYVELYGIHTFINSGGTHYFPDFLAEDFLVEDFPESANEMDYEKSDLLSALGLNSRKDLSRKEIERALLGKGPQILDREIGLDAKVYRLVCIPPDLYLRLGPSRDWGKHQVWTHFDGYEISIKGKLSALAGGDVRFGGIFDLVSVGREYSTDHLIVRFAIVQRSRMFPL